MKNNIFSFLIGIFLGSILFIPIITTRLWFIKIYFGKRYFSFKARTR